MRTADFDFELPSELIAQAPAERRDGSRLLVVHRSTDSLEHAQFPALLTHLRAGDVLILNNSRVIPARLRGRNGQTGGQFEVLLLEESSVNEWWAMMRPGKRAKLDTKIQLVDHKGAPTQLLAEVVSVNDEGHRRLRFSGTENLLNELEQLGEMPLPPYIERAAGATSEADRERYQTVFAKPPGSVAAPTAGLHFTHELLRQAEAQGVQIGHVTLHVGLGTFAPVKANTLDEHVMHEERFEVSAATATLVNNAKREGRRVIAVGTTSMRVLESVGQHHDGRLEPGAGRTRIFIRPPHRFHIVDALLTNFHLPCSTLLMLASAFAAPGETRGREFILRAYREAVQARYRFFSYGDAMFIQ